MAQSRRAALAERRVPAHPGAALTNLGRASPAKAATCLAPVNCVMSPNAARIAAAPVCAMPGMQTSRSRLLLDLALDGGELLVQEGEHRLNRDAHLAGARTGSQSVLLALAHLDERVQSSHPCLEGTDLSSAGGLQKVGRCSGQKRAEAGRSGR